MEDQALMANGKAKFSLGHDKFEVISKLPSRKFRGTQRRACDIYSRLIGMSISVGAMVLKEIA